MDSVTKEDEPNSIASALAMEGLHPSPLPSSETVAASSVMNPDYLSAG
ncbi:MAG: hypothetical protein H0U57_10555 [Tatlockia sp.]|nr:hypothetical protein [Tatlockia sp.]